LPGKRRCLSDRITSRAWSGGRAERQKILGVTNCAIIFERGAVVYAADSAALETHLSVTDRGPRLNGRPR
jgi:hypothetical protein